MAGRHRRLADPQGEVGEHRTELPHPQRRLATVWDSVLTPSRMIRALAGARALDASPPPDSDKERAARSQRQCHQHRNYGYPGLASETRTMSGGGRPLDVCVHVDGALASAVSV